MELIKVSADSSIPAVAGAIAKTIRAHHQAEAQAIGAAAVHQVLKAIILANQYLQKDGIRVGFVPEWTPVMIEAGRRNAIKFLIKTVAGTKFSSDLPADSISGQHSQT
jgi:stage V sporulation protein SpoVS